MILLVNQFVQTKTIKLEINLFNIYILYQKLKKL